MYFYLEESWRQPDGLGMAIGQGGESWEEASAAGQVSGVDGLAEAMAARMDTQARKEPGVTSRPWYLPQ